MDTAETRRRVRCLVDLEADPSHGLSIRYRHRLLRRTVRLILEQPAPESRPGSEGRGSMIGRCDHYALVQVETSRPRGSVLHAEITSVTGQSTIGRPVATTIPLNVVTP